MTPLGRRAMLIRGGTSKGLYFVADDLPANTDDCHRFLLEAMGSPDDRQIDGVGGAHPLTSKVAVVSEAANDDADVDYLFLQVMVNKAIVTDAQNCGNILAGVGPFALERGLVGPYVIDAEGVATVRIHMLNTGGVAVARFPTEDGLPVYDGHTTIAGVPGQAAAITIDFQDTAGSSCGSLLPTGNAVDMVEGVAVTLIDNGMPVVIMKAGDVGITGYEEPAELEANQSLRELLERIRVEAGPLMNLGDVRALTVPKLTIVAPPRHGGALSTRTFIPHRCHDAIGVLGAVSVATASLLDGSPAAAVASVTHPAGSIEVEHPTGTFDVAIEATITADGIMVTRSGIVRTARRLMDGIVYGRTSTTMKQQ